jgi:hypothetical protein
MSTKIYNGYRMAEGTNPFEFSRRVRTVLDPIRDQADAGLLARLFATAADRRWISGEAIPPVLSFTAFNDWEARQQEIDPNSRAYDPNGFEMCLGEDPATGRILVRAYTQRPEMAEAFSAMTDVEPYSYWNNSDAPGRLTEEDWAERESAWTRVMPGYGAPAEHMLSFVLRTPENPRTMMLSTLRGGANDPVMTRLPDRATRARNAAVSVYIRFLTEDGVDPGAAVLRVYDLPRSIDAIALALETALPELSVGLFLEGSGESRIDPDLLIPAMTACAAAYEADKAVFTAPAGA